MRSAESTIAPLATEDVVAAARLLGRSMCTNPMHLAVFGGGGEVARRRQERMFSVVLREFPGIELAAKIDRDVVGVLRMVRSPLCRLPPEEAARLGPRLLAILGEASPRVRDWFRIWSEHDPSTPHWHLGPMAVTVVRQGNGIGSALLERFCERVDEASEPAYLETDKRENVRLYRRFGFAVRQEVVIFGVTNYFMWRTAHRRPR